MFSDEQVIERLRRALADGSAGIAPDPGTLQRARSAYRPAGRGGGTAWSALALASGGCVAIVIALVAVLVLHGNRNTSGHGRMTPGQGPNRVVPGTTPHRRSGPPGRGSLPQAQQSRVDAAINTATNQTLRRDHACQGHNQGPTLVHGSPPAVLLDHLGVLRRPPTPSAALKTLRGGGFEVGQRVYVNDIRLGQTAYGNAYYLVPVGNISGYGPLPARCSGEIRARLVPLVASLPAGVQAVAFREQAQEYREETQDIGAPGLCFSIVTLRHVKPPRGVNGGCSNDTSFLQSGLDGGVGQGTRDGGQLLAAPVPDGVRFVTLRFAAGDGKKARTITEPAINNVVVFKIPRGTFHPEAPSQIIRRGADGRVISRTPSP